MTLLKVLHSWFAVENAGNRWIASRNGWRRSSHRAMNGLAGNTQRQGISLLLKCTSPPNHGTTRWRFTNNMSWRWQTCETNLVIGAVAAAEGFDATEAKKSKKKLTILRWVQHGSITSFCTFTWNALNTISLWRKLPAITLIKKVKDI